MIDYSKKHRKMPEMETHNTQLPEIDFYFARSGNSLRAAIALELSDVPFEKYELDMSQNAHKSETFLEINPAGHVPVLVLKTPNGHTILPQSGAIMEYLLSRHRPELIPEGELARATCNSIVLAALSDVAIQNALARYLSKHDDASRFVLDRMLADLRALFETVKTAPYLCGNRVTIADYAHFPVVYMRAPQLRKLPDFNHVLDWLERMSCRATNKVRIARQSG
jgi:glutathione S-transferase